MYVEVPHSVYKVVELIRSATLERSRGFFYADRCCCSDSATSGHFLLPPPPLSPPRAKIPQLEYRQVLFTEKATRSMHLLRTSRLRVLIKRYVHTK